MELREAVVVDALRTPFGKYGGALSSVRPDDLAAHVIGALVERTGIDPKEIDDVFWGAANAAGEDNRNVARMASLLAGLPVDVPGATINRLCGSGLQAVVSAAREIQVGSADIIIAGGAESMSRAPLVMLKSETPFERGNQTAYDTTLGWRMVNPRMVTLYPPISLGETAENVARRYRVSRRDQDAFALRSHVRAVKAHEACEFSREIVPIDVLAGKNERVSVSVDEGPRKDTSMERLERLSPAFEEAGTVTAGNSSPLSDGAAAVLMASRAAASRLGLRPLALFLDAATAGVHPDYMGIGPIPATRKLLERLDLRTDDLGVIEINEAFASQALACARELDVDPARVNQRGGAIAIGHPLGASGARLVTTLVHQLEASDARFGLATMCIGVGQGISAVFERIVG